MTQKGFEPAIPTRERPQTHAIDRAATWIGLSKNGLLENIVMINDGILNFVPAESPSVVGCGFQSQTGRYTNERNP